MGFSTARAALAFFPLTLLVACTVGPRTPIGPPQDDPHPDRPDPDEEEFEVPEGEAVSEPVDLPDVDKSVSEKASLEKITLGLAKVGIGARPPWATLDGLPAPPAADPSAHVPTRWTLKKSIRVGVGYLYEAEFSADEKSVVTLSTENGHFYHYDLDGKLLTEVPLPNYRQFDDAGFTMMREVTERPQLIVTRLTGTNLLDLQSGQFDVLESIPAGNAVAHSGRLGLYGLTHSKTNPQSGTIRFLWADGQVALELECANRPDQWVLSPDGRYLAISYYPAEHVELLDLKEQKVVGRVPLPKWGSAVDLSPDGSLLAIGGDRLQVVRFPTGELVAEDKRFGNNIDRVRFTPTGDLLLVSAYDRKARSYALPKDLSTMTSLPAPQALTHNGNVYAISLSRDARMLVTSSGDKTIKIWKR